MLPCFKEINTLSKRNLADSFLFEGTLLFSVSKGCQIMVLLQAPAAKLLKTGNNSGSQQRRHEKLIGSWLDLKVTAYLFWVVITSFAYFCLQLPWSNTNNIL